MDSSDIIVAASDGIWDNLSTRIIYGLLEEQQFAKSAKDIADFAIRMGSAN
jgi:serine/threonine protein phosphatase PrpC